MPEPARLANGGLSVSPRFSPARVLGRLLGDESGVALSYAVGDPRAALPYNSAAKSVEGAATTSQCPLGDSTEASSLAKATQLISPQQYL